MADPIKNGEPAPAPVPGVTPPAPVAPKPGDATPPAPAHGAPAPAPAGMVPLTALQEEREKRQSLQTELEALRKVAGQNVLFDINGRPVPQAPQPIQPQDNVRAQLDQMWEADPKKAVQGEIMAAITWYDNVNASLDDQEAELASKNPDFNTYRTQARAYVRSMPVAQRATPGAMALAYYAVRGQNVDTLLASSRAAMEAEIIAKYQAGQLVTPQPGAMGSAPAASGAVVLSEDERKVCRVMGISEQDYIKNKQVR